MDSATRRDNSVVPASDRGGATEPIGAASLTAFAKLLPAVEENWAVGPETLMHLPCGFVWRVSGKAEFHDKLVCYNCGRK